MKIMLRKVTDRWLAAIVLLSGSMLTQADEPVEFLLIEPEDKNGQQAEAQETVVPENSETPAATGGQAEAGPTAPATDGVARVADCGPAGCRPVGCPTGGCSHGSCQSCQTGACSTGAVPGMICGGCRGNGCTACNGCGVVGGCLPGCQSHAGGPCTCGMLNALCNNPFACGRPYTIGDLRCDLHHWKCNVKLDLLGQPAAGGAVDSWWANEVLKYRCRRRYRNAVLTAHIQNKLNYFVPSGGDGTGAPLFGSYSRVYALQPGYADPRDAQVFASPHTGVPTVIPVAPNVRHQYNYSWGIPSSRITPLYNVMQPARK